MPFWAVSPMAEYTFRKRPKYCDSYTPSTIRVRCRKCGQPHDEYFGPEHHDGVRAELQMVRAALDRASAIIRALGGAATLKRPRRDKRRRRA